MYMSPSSNPSGRQCTFKWLFFRGISSKEVKTPVYLCMFQRLDGFGIYALVSCISFHILLIIVRCLFLSARTNVCGY